MLTLKITPPAGVYNEFVRVNIAVEDDGESPVTTAPYEVLYTTDGSIPSDSNEVTKIYRAPLRNIPFSRSTTLKVLARTVDLAHATEIGVFYYDIYDQTARSLFKTVPATVANYTLMINEVGDLVPNGSGAYEIVHGVEKTKQDVRESILVESVGENQSAGTRLIPQFGSALNRLLGQSYAPNFTASLLRSSLYDSMNVLMALQKLGRAPAHERIRRVLSVDVVPKKDPTGFRYRIVVQTESGEQVSEIGTIVGG